MNAIIFIYISTILVSVIANPVPQTISIQTCPYQQTGYCNQPIKVPVILQQTTNQPVLNQNQIKPQENPFNENINQILVSQILSNPSLQKILDPNTKLYNQNGVEIKRHTPSTGVVPNIVNNYFIVPPEFLNLNDTCLKTGCSQPKQIIRSPNRRVVKGNTNRKDAQINTNKRQNPTEISDAPTNERVIKRIEDDNVNVIDQRQTKTDKQKGNDEKNNTLPKSDSEVEGGESQKPRRKKRKRKKDKQNIDEASVEGIEENNRYKTNEEPIAEDNRDQIPNERKSQRKARPKTNNQNEPVGPTENIIDNTSLKMGKKTSKVDQDFQNKTKYVDNIEVPEIVYNDRSQLKDIETPVESTELEQERDLRESRLARNSKNETVVKDVPRNKAGPPNDIYRSFFPYMPYYPNGNFAFNYDQFLQSLHFANSRRSDSNNIRRRKQKRNRKNQKNQHQVQSTSSNLNDERKPALKADNMTMTANNTTTEIPNVLIQTNLGQNQSKKKPQTVEQVIEIPMELPHEVSPTHIDKKSESVEVFDNKSRFKGQDYKIHDYVVQELGTEDVLPAIHRNGIINDYYPVFNNDDAYLSSDEDYYVHNLDNDRYFYTTDRNLDTELNRDRRKHKTPNEDKQRNPQYYRDRDRYSYNNERDETRQRYREYEEPTTQKVRRIDNTQAKTRRPVYESEEVQFQTPPVLDFPDFRTKKVQKELIEPDTDNSDDIERFVYDFTDKSSSYSDVKTPQYNTRVKPNADIQRVRVPSRNSKPKPNNVETVFARSKVAKYGQTSGDSDEETSTPLTHYGDEPQYYSDDGTTYVLAKSLYEDDYW